MKDLKDKIIDKLKEYDIEVFNSFDSEDDTIILATNISLALKNDEVFLNFHIDCKPSYAARILLVLQEVKEIKAFMIGEDFLFDGAGKFLDGQEAIEYDQAFKKNLVIQEFMATQSKLYYLNTAKPFNC
jgi:hypothetical protein